jgi:Fe2+ or Zn2+ uptake regulation protein
VRRVHRADGCHAYFPASPGHSHAVICSGCGRATEFSGGDDVRPLIERVEEATGFTVDSHLLQLSGLCPDCQGSGDGLLLDPNSGQSTADKVGGE